MKRIDPADIEFTITVLMQRRRQPTTLRHDQSNTGSQKVVDHVSRIDRIIAWLREKEKDA